MAVSYVKLWKLLIERKLKKTDLLGLSGISSSTLAKLGHDEYVSMESLEKICSSLGCDAADIFEFTSGKEGE